MKRKRILVPVDGSEGSGQAVALAGELALATGCTLDILHVSYFDSSTDSQSDSWLPEEVAGAVGCQQQEVLDKANAEEMCVLSSPLTAYEICGRLAAQGIPAHG